MRYYDIQITGGAGKNNGSTLRYTSHPKGKDQPPDPGALQIEMDLFSIRTASSEGGTTNISSYIRIWGIPLSVMSQAMNFNNSDIKIFGGMGKGLPLSKPALAGILVRARILQCYGNWIGTNMTLDLQLAAGGDMTVTSGPRNLVQDYKANAPFDASIKQTITTAFPGATVDIKINPNLKLPNDQPAYWDTLNQFGDYLLQMSKSVLGSNDPKYPGVQIVAVPTKENTFLVFDTTQGPGTGSQGSPKVIDFTDLIGQPTWQAPQQIMVTCAMRSDILVGDFIKLPPTQINVTQQALSAFSAQRQSSIFQGTFWVSQVRHVGNFKQPSAESWVTHITCTGPISSGG